MGMSLGTKVAPIMMPIASANVRSAISAVLRVSRTIGAQATSNRRSTAAAAQKGLVPSITKRARLLANSVRIIFMKMPYATSFARVARHGVRYQQRGGERQAIAGNDEQQCYVRRARRYRCRR